jgi:AcrR family transcriptional regulator
VSDVNARRSYSSTLRKSQAEATRRAVLDAARDLFIARGYGATTVEQIAERAGVSKPTVFSAVGNKQMLLHAVRDIAIAGDDEPVPVAKRPAADHIREEPDLQRAIALLARHLTTVASRYAVIYDVLRAAAANGEEELRQLWAAEEEQRLTGARFWIEILRAKGAALRPGTEARTAVDTLWLLMAPDHYNRLVLQRNWSRQKYQRWLATLISQLFAEMATGQLVAR